jgi:glutamate--cysteine ligase
LSQSIDSRLNRLIAAGQQHLLRNGLKGLEKESLRMTAGGTIAQTAHPAALGSALTHPYITTDYSEALLELITPPFADPVDAVRFLEDVHSFVYAHLEGGEFLLGTSMPIGLNGDESIPIAQYGTSNIGRMKRIYRQGLAYRYGRAMQSIAGVHFNFSVNEALWPVLAELLESRDPLPKFIADAYFGIIRNVHRYGWLVIYLFGMSPTVCKSFFRGREHLAAAFPEFDAETLYRPYATSLRMSDIGYRNDNQAALEISFDNLDDYVASLGKAIDTPYRPYERIGVKVGGEYRQLNSNILQIENEYYSGIRPKQVTESGEKPTLALKRRGIRYIELRSLDLACFSPAAADVNELRFLEVFLLFCLMADSPLMNSEERAEAGRNSLKAACCGRTPGFELQREGREVLLREWALELIGAMRSVAEILDGEDPEQPYHRSLDSRIPAIADPAASPSAQMLDEMRRNRESFAEYARRLSGQHADYFRNRPLSAEKAELFGRQARESLEEQQRIEAGDTLGFDEFLRRYFAQA